MVIKLIDRSHLYLDNMNTLRVSKSKNRKNIEIKCIKFIPLFETGSYVAQAGLRLSMYTAKYVPLDFCSTSQVLRLQVYTTMRGLCKAGG